MSKANEPAYPMCNELGVLYAVGLSKKERLAMEIYARRLASRGNFFNIDEEAVQSLRAADIFFEAMEKNK